ncbi:MAG: hypothetical protein J6R29_06650 [Clostridia bacterium]|nr:hypothetical protein [Clostridia bacterium]
MSSNERIQGVNSGLIIKSIGTAITLDPPKHKNTSIIVAYLIKDNANDVQFVAIKPSKKVLTRKEVLSAISKVEGRKEIYYLDFDGKDKDIYVCRENSGEVYDFVERDVASNKYVKGFAEIESAIIPFEADVKDFKINQKLKATVNYTPIAPEYENGSLRYAIINAYNACLLGKAFSREEFHLETGDGERVKVEVRSLRSKYVDLSTLYVKPEAYEGEKLVNSYVTETINVINGNDMEKKTYRLSFKKSLNDYFIAKCD